jgi:hypothetical protein
MNGGFGRRFYLGRKMWARAFTLAQERNGHKNSVGVFSICTRIRLREKYLRCRCTGTPRTSGTLAPTFSLGCAFVRQGVDGVVFSRFRGDYFHVLPVVG